MLETKKWPSSWRTEYGVPLQKMSNPVSENQLRIISLTSFFSKCFENLVIKSFVVIKKSVLTKYTQFKGPHSGQPEPRLSRWRVERRYPSLLREGRLPRWFARRLLLYPRLFVLNQGTKFPLHSGIRVRSHCNYANWFGQDTRRHHHLQQRRK